MKMAFCLDAHAHFEADSPEDAARKIARYFEFLASALRRSPDPEIPPHLLTMGAGSTLELKILYHGLEVLH